jgi:hypothetical protein
MDRNDVEGRALLEAAGFTFNKAVDCWIQRTEGRVISRPTIEQHDLAWLAEWIGQGKDRA